MPQILMQLMRHESIETTMRYYVGRNAETAADVLWKAMSNTSSNSLPAASHESSGESSQPVDRKDKSEVRVLGLEPKTYGLKVRCSTN